jgi:hypothetical protein
LTKIILATSLLEVHFLTPYVVHAFEGSAIYHHIYRHQLTALSAGFLFAYFKSSDGMLHVEASTTIQAPRARVVEIYQDYYTSINSWRRSCMITLGSR